jgi:serine/threonine-protein kinase
VLEGVSVKTSGAANFDISGTGHLVHVGATTTEAQRTIAWVDRMGRETPIDAPPRNYYYVRISPDGARLSLDVRDKELDIWIWDLKREIMTRLTDQSGRDEYGLWTPDGRVVFASGAGSNRFELFRHRPDGVGTPERITDTAADKLVPFPNAITPDGTHVIFRAVTATKNDLFAATLTDPRMVKKLLATEHDERNAALSPDGRWMAFESDQSGGRVDVFVRPFPNVDGWQVKVSSDGGYEPVWSPSGRELFYGASGPKPMLMSVAVTGRDQPEFGKPVPLFDLSPYFFGGVGRNYDVSPDGTRFVMVKNPPTAPKARNAPISITLNWIEELRARVK